MRGGFYGVFFSGAVFGLWWLLAAHAATEDPMSMKAIKKGWVRLDVPATHVDAVLSWSLTIDNAELVKSLLDEPLRTARLDEDPSDYAFLGVLHIEHEQGHEDIMLYHPFGHYKRNGKYYVGKFDDLRTEIDTFYKNAIRHILKKKGDK